MNPLGWDCFIGGPIATVKPMLITTLKVLELALKVDLYFAFILVF